MFTLLRAFLVFSSKSPFYKSIGWQLSPWTTQITFISDLLQLFIRNIYSLYLTIILNFLISEIQNSEFPLSCHQVHPNDSIVLFLTGLISSTPCPLVNCLSSLLYLSVCPEVYRYFNEFLASVLKAHIPPTCFIQSLIFSILRNLFSYFNT